MSPLTDLWLTSYFLGLAWPHHAQTTSLQRGLRGCLRLCLPYAITTLALHDTYFRREQIPTSKTAWDWLHSCMRWKWWGLHCSRGEKIVNTRPIVFILLAHSFYIFAFMESSSFFFQQIVLMNIKFCPWSSSHTDLPTFPPSQVRN